MLCSEFRSESPVDQFLFEEREFDGVKSVRLTSDICMLSNQQRLDRLSRESLLSHFESMSVNEPKFGDLRAKLGVVMNTYGKYLDLSIEKIKENMKL